MASINQERPDLSFAVVNYDVNSDADTFATFLVAEMEHQEDFTVSYYNKDLHRHSTELVLAEPRDAQRHEHQLNKDDVIIVTGGAKGITAASVLALAEKTGSKFALIGSTPMTEERTERTTEIFDTLESFKKANIDARYYSCNILDSGSVAGTVKAITEDLGKVTAIINGAGVNKPVPAMMSDKGQALKEFNVKVMGAQNFLSHVDHESLSFFGLTNLRHRRPWYAE